MGKKRLNVRKIREILRLHFTAGLSNRQISENLKISKTTVQDCKDRFQRAGLSWPLQGDVTDDVLHGKLYPGVVIRNGKPQPDWVTAHLEMKRRHVTLQLLWEEYRDTYPDGMGRSQFYEHYSKFCGSQEEPVMRMVHKGGEKLYIDFSGDGRIRPVNPYSKSRPFSRYYSFAKEVPCPLEFGKPGICVGPSPNSLAAA